MTKRTDASRSLPAVLDDALKSATWLTPADAAAVEIAKILAKELFGAVDVREIVSLSKQLNDQLQTLGMNIAGRTGKAEAEKEVSPRDAIRARSQIRLAETKAVKSKPAPTKPRAGSSRTSGSTRDASAPVAGSRTRRSPQGKTGKVGA